jgi:2-phosphosulfolactate phosphatase
VAAGLIATHLEGLGLVLSAEAGAAARLARATEIPAAVRDCASGRELAEQGFGMDVDCAVALDADPVSAVLEGGLLLARH